MFTGLVEAAGEVVRFDESQDGFQLDVEMPESISDWALGDSIAVNGCCLTVARSENRLVSFDLLAETVKRTSFAQLQSGQRVNLERSLLPTSRMGGHFVSGHIDEAGVIDKFEPRGADFYLAVSCSHPSTRYLIEKGSITVDGISLTVAEVLDDGFAVWLIPHTRNHTNLRFRVSGDRVNLEFDLLAKHVERMLQVREESFSDRKVHP